MVVSNEVMCLYSELVPVCFLQRLRDITTFLLRVEVVGFHITKNFIRQKLESLGIAKTRKIENRKEKGTFCFSNQVPVEISIQSKNE